jgi:hypothetical protein
VRYLRIWADLAGETHLEEVTPDFREVEGYARDVPVVSVSAAERAGETYFLKLPRGWAGDFHPAPARQYLAQLSGSLRVTMSDGTKVETNAGTMWLIEDVEGRGHRTEVIGGEDVVLFVATAPDT